MGGQSSILEEGNQNIQLANQLVIQESSYLENQITNFLILKTLGK